MKYLYKINRRVDDGKLDKSGRFILYRVFLPKNDKTPEARLGVPLQVTTERGSLPVRLEVRRTGRCDLDRRATNDELIWGTFVPRDQKEKIIAEAGAAARKPRIVVATL